MRARSICWIALASALFLACGEEGPSNPGPNGPLPTDGSSGGLVDVDPADAGGQVDASPDAGVVEDAGAPTLDSTAAADVDSGALDGDEPEDSGPTLDVVTDPLEGDAASGELDLSGSTVSVEEPGSTAADGLSALLVTVTVIDGLDAPMAGVPVTLVVADAPGVIIDQAGVTDADGVATGRIMAIDGGDYTVSAVLALEAGALTLDDTATASFVGCATTADHFRRALRGPVFETCTGCHNGYGLAPAYGAWHIPMAVDEGSLAEAFQVLTPLATLEVGGTPLLVAKPLGQLGHYGGTLVVEGSLAHAHLEAFVARLSGASEGCDPVQVDLFAGVTLLDEAATFDKAAFALLGRLATPAEAQVVETDGLQAAVRGLLGEAAFFERLEELYNDLFLTDRIMGSFKLLSHLAKGDYPNRFYFRSFQANVAQYNKLKYTCDGQADVGGTCCLDQHDPDTGLQCDHAGEMVGFCEHGDAHAVGALRRQGLSLISHVVRNELPFTEILTADYTLVNPATAPLFELPNGTNAVTFDDPCDMDEFVPIQLTMGNLQGVTLENAYPSGAVPHAGVLSTHPMLNRYMTTPTNLNRHRAATIYQKLLDVDIQSLTEVVVGQDEDLSGNPTMDGWSCAVCHAVMDPVAGAFHKWTANGQVRRGRLWHVCDPTLAQCELTEDCGPEESCTSGVCVDAESGYDPNLCVRPVGYRGTLMPAEHDKAPLRWLAAQIAEDPRFPRATVKTLLGMLTSVDLAELPSDLHDEAYAAEVRAFLAQEREIERVRQAFVHPDNAMNLKTAIVELVSGPWFRAVDAEVGAVDEPALLAGEVGSGKLLTPEQLDRKIEALTGLPWRSAGSRAHALRDGKDGYLLLYGGIDSDTLVDRVRDPFAVAAAVARRMAHEMACLTVGQDFAWNDPGARRFFGLLDPTMSPLDAQGEPAHTAEILATIQGLHRTLLGEDLVVDDVAITETYSLFVNVWQLGQDLLASGSESATLPEHCQATTDFHEGVPFAFSSQWERTSIIEDPDYVLRAWMAVLSYLLSDARFLLE